MCKVVAALFAIMKDRSEQQYTTSGINHGISLGGCKRNEGELYRLLWSAFQDVLLSKKNGRVQKNVYRIIC